jgi:hypothetical protein
MNKTKRNAEAHATRIEWDTDEAHAYAVALLTACNMHTEAAALVAAHQAIEAETAEFLAQFETE